MSSTPGHLPTPRALQQASWPRAAPDYQHWRLDLLDEARGDATQECVPEAAAPVASKHNQATVELAPHMVEYTK